MNFANIVPTLSCISLVDNRGEEVTLVRGEYRDHIMRDIKSVKVADFTKAIFFENEDGDGKHFFVHESCEAVELDFIPAVIVVETYAKAFKTNRMIDWLSEGEYSPEDIKKYEKIVVPRGFYIIFTGHNQDMHKMKIFENEEYIIDETIDFYDKILLFTLGSDDIRLNFGTKEELSDDELITIAGGKCKVHCAACNSFCPCHVKNR